MNRLIDALLAFALAFVPASALAQAQNYPTAQTPFTGQEKLLGTQGSGLLVNFTPDQLKVYVGGSGTVNNGVINGLPYYAAAGNVLTGLATGNNGVLVTSSGGVPSISSTLPSALTIPSPTFTGTVSGLSGSGASLTALNATAISTGTVGTGRLSGSYTGVTGVGTLTAGAIGSGFTAIPNSALANSSVTINGSAFSLGSSGTLTTALASQVSGTLPVGNGGTGATTFTANAPLIGNGTGAVALGSRGGNTTVFGTVSGTLTAGDCVQIDSNHNLVDAGGACTTGGGGGTVTSGAAHSLAYYASAGTVVTALSSANNSVLVTSGSGVPSISSTLPSGLTVPYPTFSASTTSAASLNVAPGVAPTSPNNGDLWTTSGGVFAQIGGVTDQFAYLTSSITGNAATASALRTAQAISLTGAVTTTCPNFDGSGGISCTTVLPSASVPLTGLATQGANTIVANNTGSTASPTAVAASSLCGSGAPFACQTDSRFYGPIQNSQSAAYTFVLADAGGQIYHPSADTTARTYTVPANASVAYAVGTKIEIVNDCSAGPLTLAITSDTMVWFPSGTTGTRTIAACGLAELSKITTNRWVLTGVGIT